MTDIFSTMYQPKGKKYSSKSIKKDSHYYEPIEHNAQ